MTGKFENLESGEMNFEYFNNMHTGYKYAIFWKRKKNQIDKIPYIGTSFMVYMKKTDHNPFETIQHGKMFLAGAAGKAK